MLDDDYSYADSDDEEANFFGRGISHNDHYEYEQQIRENELDDAFAQRVRCIREKESTRADLACKHSIRIFPQLKLALATANKKLENRQEAAVFAVDKIRPHAATRQLKYIKSYLVGSPLNIFLYACRCIGPVNLDEVVLAGKPVPVHFDIEIKQCQDDFSVGREDVLRQHVLGVAVGTIENYEEKIVRLAQTFREMAKTGWTEAVCRAGLKVVQEHISRTIREMLAVGASDEDASAMTVVTGCRAEKFSLHVVMNRVYCDAQERSMPLVVYEIARSFGVLNTQWLLEVDEATWDTPEGMFRIRSLMVNAMLDDRGLFRGYDDTPFDEAIYTGNHLLRAPGCCKASGGNALAPIVGDGPLLVAETEFARLFPETAVGYGNWAWHTVASRPSESSSALNSFEQFSEKRYLLFDWKPSDTYPRKRGWFTAFRTGNQLLRSDLEGEFDIVLPKPDVWRYKEKRNVQLRETRDNATRGAFMSGDPMMGKEEISAEAVFRSETGERKKFRFFRPDEWLFHVHGEREERTPSAKVFSGGFRCFGCNRTFGVLRTHSQEEPYYFKEEETTEVDDPSAYIGQHIRIRWGPLMRKKWFVMDAPMGAGKTEELKNLVYRAEAEGKKVLVVTFRQALATQLAKRFDISCYLSVPNDQLAMQTDEMIVVCVNSLQKLGAGMMYDIVILDECGLTRRHFLSSVTSSVLVQVYDRFVSLVQGAEFVVMCQDGISRDDIQFYTELDGTNCENRDKVSALAFRKPIVVHPISYTTDSWAAVLQMLKAYEESLVGGLCMHPFMVFCSSKTFAEFLVEQLKAKAILLKADANRIKGFWGALRATCKFCQEFVDDPNSVADQADVIVATSVIGAGFSINQHFQSCHAFLFTRILLHEEERQFIQRLRFVAVGLPENAKRQSYLFVEEGNGREGDYSVVLEDTNAVRKAYRKAVGTTSEASILGLEQTQARVKAEQMHSFSLHDKLWVSSGGKFQSDFSPMEIDVSDDERLTVKKLFSQFSKKRKRHIADILGDAGDDGRRLKDLGTELSLIESNDGMDLYRVVAAYESAKKLEDGFIDVKLARGIIERLYIQREKRNKVFSDPSKIIQKARQLVVWLVFLYGHLTEEGTNSVFGHLLRRELLAKLKRLRIEEDKVLHRIERISKPSPPSDLFFPGQRVRITNLPSGHTEKDSHATVTRCSDGRVYIRTDIGVETWRARKNLAPLP